MLRQDATTATPDTQTQKGIGFVKPALSLLVAAGLAVTLYEKGLEDRVEMKNLGLVEPGLWRSGQFSRFMVGPALAYVEPDLIVSLSEDKSTNADNMAEKAAAASAGIERVHVSLKGDGTGDPMEYVTALGYVIDARREGKTVLVHCYAGSERTGGMIALYRTLVQGRPADEAILDELSGYKHDVEDGVLIDYLNANVETIATELHARGHLAEIPRPLPHFGKP